VRLTVVGFPASDVEAAKAFYASLFGWQVEDVDVGAPRACR
jgi:predicted enzyme related to lactoylglutathione lyase